MNSGLSTKLKLAYAPICNFDFTFLKKEEIVQQLLKKSMLYVITQRPVILFDNITFDRDERVLHFELKITGREDRLTCELPLYQENIEPDEARGIYIEFGSYDKDWTGDTFPVNDVNGLKFYNKEREFLFWVSPEKFLHHRFNNILEAAIQGKIEPFISYSVHYVGKATEQDIWDRLTGHNSLQDVLSRQFPLNYGALPTHEIVLLLFEVNDMLSMETLDAEADSAGVDAFVAKLFGEIAPTSKEVALDAEKMLVKLLNPEYNDKKFPNYPKGKDGLYKHSYDTIVYHFAENIILQYQAEGIRCHIEEEKSDLIIVKDRKAIEIHRLNEDNIFIYDRWKTEGAT
jgi:hypothetical protein